MNLKEGKHYFNLQILKTVSTQKTQNNIHLEKTNKQTNKKLFETISNLYANSCKKSRKFWNPLTNYGFATKLKKLI